MWSLFPSISNDGLHRTSEFPLQLLQEAIDTRVDSKVYEVLRIERILKELIQSTTSHKIPSDPYQPKYNVFTCVQAAVLQGIPHVVLAMHRFNPTDVQLATWYALYRLKKDNQQMKVPRELVKIAKAQRRSWLWDQIGPFILVRQTSRVGNRHRRRFHPVAIVPDEAFKIILSFVDLHENREARILRFLIEVRPYGEKGFQVTDLPMRCNRPPHLDVSSISCFHEALYYGQVDVARRLIYRTPSLANARSSSSPHPTSLMVCGTSRQASLKNTLTLLKLLLAKGASLRTKDDHRCSVLMAVCASGAHQNIVKCLLEWDQINSKHKVLLWSDEDDQGRTALGLASLNGHGRLASFILDVLGAEEEMGILNPLYALNMALHSGDERCVMELLRSKMMQRVVRDDRRERKLTVHGEWYQPQSGDEEVTVSTCVAKAVENDMVRVVREMH
ncbi:Hypothetical protein PHPALM_6788 [Phytophthora palmivora]|uniref:Uncharacterized protein n=1 Tax=Phytophthora palmivora TaxID=4796 RepID=A0A2P4YDW9_9STRA|nr:Hypothetical protein PHPALM_6788 [Phytophthora palmivora]